MSYSSTVGGGSGGGTTPPPAGGGATVGMEAVYWHHNDHLGTPQTMTDINGTKVWEMSQTPFGITTVNEDVDGDGLLVVNNFRFPGQYFDAETGLNYNYFRTYFPGEGRYNQSDPIGLYGGMNTYAYVGGNPITRFDLLGLSGIAIDFGGAYGTGFGEGLSDSGSAGTGFYIGGRDPNTPNIGGSYAEIGGFTYQGKGNTKGAKIGLGITLTHYKIDADNFFKGTLTYKEIDILGVTYIEYYDDCGNLVGRALSFGKGVGASKGKGKIQGWSSILQ